MALHTDIHRLLHNMATLSIGAKHLTNKETAIQADKEADRQKDRHKNRE